MLAQLVSRYNDYGRNILPRLNKKGLMLEE
jgi:hypothetical protein